MFNQICSIISNIKLSENIYKLVFKSADIAKSARPGQFVHIKINIGSSDPLLRRPISINSIDDETITIIYKVVGQGTELLKDKIIGDPIEVLGPLGNGFDIVDAKNYIIVGGGIGIAPLLPLAKEVSSKKQGVRFFFFLGGNSESDLIDLDEYKKISPNVFVATMDGTAGHKGFVTDLVKDKIQEIGINLAETAIYSCGPDVMLKALGKTLTPNIPAHFYVSMENRMGCGIGVCLGCVIDTVRGKERVCKDGPVFEWKDVVWAEEVGAGGMDMSIPYGLEDVGPKHACSKLINVAGIKFKNPVITASGTFGYGTDYQDLFDVEKLGGITVKGVSLEAWEGNNDCRLIETPSGLINSIGLQNLGVQDFIKNKLPRIKDLDTNIIVNVSEHSIDGYAKLTEILSEQQGIDALEINISCPNVDKGGIVFGQNPDMVCSVLKKVKANTDLPIIAKLTPNVTSVVDIALAAETGGADAVSLVNTFLAMAIDVETQRPILGNIKGGLSGPAIRPIAVRMVWDIFESSCKLPIIGMGGISNARDAIEFMLAGASLVACGTGTFVDPCLALDVVEGIREYVQVHGFGSVEQLVGAAHKH